VRVYNRRAWRHVASRTTIRLGWISSERSGSEPGPSGHSSHVPGACSNSSSRDESPMRLPPPQEIILEFGMVSATNRPVLLGRRASAMCRKITNSVRVRTVGRIGQMQISRRWQQFKQWVL